MKYLLPLRKGLGLSRFRACNDLLFAPGLSAFIFRITFLPAPRIIERVVDVALRSVPITAEREAEKSLRKLNRKILYHLVIEIVLYLSFADCITNRSFAYVLRDA